MNQNAATEIRQACPTCGHKARRVSLRTIRSLLKEPAASGFQDGESECCAPKTMSRWSMAAMNKLMLWAVTLLAIAFLAFPSYVDLLFGAGGNAVVTDDMNRAVLAIEGMTCEGCATTVAEAIKRVDGVIAVEVNDETKQATIGAEACCPVPIAEIKSALAKVGDAGEPIDSTD